MIPLSILVLLSAVDPGSPGCSLIHPVAADEAAAQRIAKAVVSNVPAMQMARDAAAAGQPYRLIVRADRGDPGKWLAFQMPRERKGRDRPGYITLYFAGHGLGFKIDRCTGAISDMAYQR
jgi:hypothetical protein